LSLRVFLPEYMAKRVQKRVGADNVYVALRKLCDMGDYELASYIASGLAGGREPTNNFWITPPSSKIKTCYTTDKGNWLIIVFGFEVEGATDYTCIVIEFDEEFDVDKRKVADVGFTVRPCSMREYNEYVSEKIQAETVEKAVGRTVVRAEVLPLRDRVEEAGEEVRRRAKRRSAEHAWGSG